MSQFCSQALGGLGLDCGTSLGGIKRVFIANYSDVAEVTLDEVSGEITDIEMVELKDAEGNPIPDKDGKNKTAKFMPYSFRKQTGSMTSTLTVEPSSGVNYVSTQLDLVFTKMETKKRLAMSSLALGQLAVIVQDSNNVYYYLGFDDYVSATGGTGETSVNKGDRNAYSISLTDESTTFPYTITESAVEAVIGTVE